ncbi:hypothetical protein JG688_00008175, partial [Phytophthora aleatoria]
MLLQSFSSLGMPQLEDSTEIQSFFLPQNPAFTVNQALSPNLPPLPPQLQQQPEQQYAMPIPAMPTPQAATRSSVDYFPEGIPTLHSMHGSVPTLPPSFGSLEQAQQQQQPVALEDQNDSVVQDTGHTMFHPPLLMTPTDEDNSLQTTLTLPTVNFPARPSSSISDDTPPDYSPVIAPIGRAKRGCGLSEPFTQMTTAQEPKFSPDKRKLCCVEGCKSQARAFNRCKRHGGSKRCSSPGCTKSVQSRGLCIRHGGGSRCQEPGCTRASQSHGRCKMHGGGRPCVVAGCEKKAHLKRLCRRHGGGAKCCVTGCEKWAQRQGMCMTHSKVVATQPTATSVVGETFVYRSPPPPSAPDSPLPPSLQMFTEEFVSVNVENMFDTSSSGSRPLRHDAETFRVAEELIMLSSRAASASSMDRKPNDSPSNISGFFEHTAKTEKRVPKVKAKKGRSQRWNIEQRNKKQEYLARFHVQGIPLVQHLEALTHWRRGAHHETQRQQAQAKDKTALEIAANEALFGQTGGSADEPWALGLSSTSSTSGGGSGSGGPWGSADATWFGASPAQTATATENVFTRSGNHNPARSGRSVGNSVRKATGGGDSLPLASADAPSMGNYDRDAHLRMPMAQRITGHPQVSQVAATSTISHHLPHRMKNAPPTNTTGNSNNSSSTVPYFHHFLDRSNNSSSSSSTNSLPFNQTSSFADSVPTDHPLPDFSTNWGFNGRNVSRSSSSTSNAPMSTSATMTTTSHSISNVTTTSNLAGIGSGFSSPNGASMFAGVDSFLPDYDSTLYSLWNAPGGGSVMGYETENDAAQGQQQQVQPPLYMTSDDELKMDYPQLPEFNQDLDSYLNDAMDS